jgi:hypothetical protein
MKPRLRYSQFWSDPSISTKNGWWSLTEQIVALALFRFSDRLVTKSISKISLPQFVFPPSNMVVTSAVPTETTGMSVCESSTSAVSSVEDSPQLDDVAEIGKESAEAKAKMLRIRRIRIFSTLAQGLVLLLGCASILLLLFVTATDDVRIAVEPLLKLHVLSGAEELKLLLDDMSAPLRVLQSSVDWDTITPNDELMLRSFMREVCMSSPVPYVTYF